MELIQVLLLLYVNGIGIGVMVVGRAAGRFAWFCVGVWLWSLWVVVVDARLFCLRGFWLQIFAIDSFAKIQDVLLRQDRSRHISLASRHHHASIILLEQQINIAMDRIIMGTQYREYSREVLST